MVRQPHTHREGYTKIIGVFATFCILGTLSWIIINGTAARFAWRHGYHGAAYHLNYTDESLAMTEGFYYFGNGAYDLPRAAAAFRLALRLKPGVLWGHYELARIYFVEGDFKRATAEVDAEIAANPGNVRTLYERGLIEESAGDLADAETDFTAFIAFVPHEWGGYNDGAYTLAEEGEYAASAALVEEAMRQVPGAGDNPWLWNSLGLAELNQVHYKEAQASFEKAATLAQGLTTQEWQRAYSADDPAAASQSMKNFQTAIAQNLSLARQGAAL